MPQDVIAIFWNDQRLQFVVADHLGQAHLLKEYTSTDTKGTDLLHAVFSKDEDIRRTYNKSYLVLQSPISLLEPIVIDEIGTSDLTQYLIPNVEGVSLQSDRIESAGIKVRYSIEDDSVVFAQKMFSNLTIRHHHTLLIQHFDALSANLPDDRVYIQLDSQRLSIFYYKDSNLQYGNQFQALQDEDRIYYIMLIYKQFDLDAATVPLSISLGSGLKSSIVGDIRAYVQHIQVLEYQPSKNSSGSVFQDSMIYKQFYLALSSLSMLR